MKNLKYSIILAMIFLYGNSLFSQKEIFFDNTPKDSIKVHTLSGIEIGYAGRYEPRMILDLMGGDVDPTEDFHSVQVNYLKEYPIFPTISLILKGGLGITQRPDFITSSPMGGDILGYKYNNSYGVILSAEPRWYYGYKRRFVEGKAKLNSGGFFTLPLEYNSYTEPSRWSYVTILLSPQCGFREAIFDNIYIEGMLGCSLSTQSDLYVYTIDKVIHWYPTASLKIGYTL
jgi:hypothetical protein